MADSRTLKLTFLGDVSNLTQSINKADNETSGFGDKMEGIGKKVGLAMAAAAAAVGAYAIKLGVDGVKAAIEDEAAQAKLATTLKNVTSATDAQVASVESWISKTQMAFGVSDKDLRPALERLARATGDVTKAQDLTSLALDVSAGSGKSLEAVANALGKAYEGNTVSLGKLGLGIDKTQLKTMSFDDITQTLAATFKDQASIQADTFEGKVRRLGEAWGEAKETVGSFIIDALTPLLNVFTNTLLPNLEEVSTKIGKNLKEPMEAVGTVIKDVVLPVLKSYWSYLTETVIPGVTKTVKPIIEALGTAFSTVANAIKDNKDKLAPLFTLLKEVGEFIFKTLAPIFGSTLGVAIKVAGEAIAGVIKGIATVVDTITKGIQGAVNLAIGAINTLINAWNKLPDWLRPGGKVGNITPITLTSAPSNGGPGSSNNLDGARYTAQVPASATTVPTITVPTVTPEPSTSTSKTAEVADNSAILAEYVDTAKIVNTAITAAATSINITLDNIMDEIARLKTQPTTVVVEGTLIDPEGAARAIETTLYDSNQRTGSNGLLMGFE